MFFKCLKWSDKKSEPKVDEDHVVQWILCSAEQCFPQFFEHSSQDKFQREQKFQCIALFMTLAFYHLKENPEIVQRLHDKMFDLFDIALREQGVADVRVGAEIRKLSSAFQGRYDSYTAGLNATSPAVLKEALARNGVLDDDAQLVEVSAHVYTLWQEMSAQPAEIFYLLPQKKTA